MSNNVYAVKKLGENTAMYFQATTAHEALKKLIYTLNLKRLDKSAKVMLSASARYLWTEHSGEVWAVENRALR